MYKNAVLSNFSPVWLCATLWTVACQAPLSVGIFQARVLEWVAIAFSNAGKWKGKVKSLSRVQLFTTPSNYSFGTLSNFSEQFPMLTDSSSRFSSAPNLTLPLELPRSSTYKGPSCHQTAIKNKTCGRQQNLFSSHLIWLLRSLWHSLLVFYPLPLGKGKK